ncbi:hypothetical protein JCM10599A_56880 [Paraburkholderia kururiensis]|nr:twin-arginine translocation signal domain-containing protein [Paraburkholderia kururiensis]
MMTRRDFIQTAAAAGAVAALSSAGANALAATPLQWKHFPAGEKGFFRAPVLLSGTKEAILIDGGFSLSDGRAVADAIKAFGKTLIFAHLYCLKDGKILSMEQYVDSHPVQQALLP